MWTYNVLCGDTMFDKKTNLHVGATFNGHTVFYVHETCKLLFNIPTVNWAMS